MERESVLDKRGVLGEKGERLFRNGKSFSQRRKFP